MNFKRWALYGGIEPATLSPIDARGLRLWRYCQWIVVLLILVFFLVAVHQGIGLRIVCLSVGWALCMAGLFVTRPSLRSLSINLTMLGANIAVATGTYTNGGLGTAASAWIVYLPLLAGVMGGARAARVWVYGAGGVLAAFLIAQFLGVPMPNLTPPELVYRQDVLQLVMQVIAVAMMLSGLIGQVELSEKAMSQTIQSLHREVASRIEAEEKAIAAEHKKAAFFTSMSHELKTPLNAIIGFARMAIKQAKHGPLDERGQDALQRVLTNGQDMLNLVKNLLVIAKSDEGKTVEDLLEFDLAHVVHEVVADMQSLAEPGVVLEDSVATPLVLKADMAALRRVLVNLIGNALKFTEQGSVKVSLNSRVTGGKTWFAISVVDTGPGIPNEELPFLFEPYTRGVTTQSKSGTGLGLALSQQWAGQLGGYIEVSTRLGEGSEFSLYLPSELAV
ncbi:HAMP domain-containing histidine kinase [Simiduia sp. 21SJ11W-1]|uniref:sensor histidine kinase n=1 Tax=Simiduia sp. 21SJ11W-1 TaxID=2909669 RepID=UPI00209E6211|nr:HAMP domain-containing sensor histidine kinase [Simiduia sp. 21SJ11W-1]UTA49230.1 HAMP domain-containing histidine kinase [Simiduia sp. 21SJ11W-1]